MKKTTSNEQECSKCKQLFSPGAIDDKICLECKKKTKKNRQLVIWSILGLLLIATAGSYYFFNQKITPDSTFEGVVDNDSIDMDNVFLESKEVTGTKEIINLGEAVGDLSAFKRLSEDNISIPAKIQILFNKNEVEISESSDLFLSHFVDEFIELGDNYSILLEGYTCDLGTEEYNSILSKNRVQVIKDYLESRSINNDLFETKSYGKSLFVDNGDLEKSRVENRRVYITINKITQS